MAYLWRRQAGGAQSLAPSAGDHAAGAGPGGRLAARKAWRRVPETTLLVLGLAGGWPGAILGQQCFRHKTQKQPFRTRFFISVALNVAALAGLYVVYTHLLSR